MLTESRTPVRTHGVRALLGAYADGRADPRDIIDLLLSRGRGDNPIWISRMPDERLRRRADELARLRRKRAGDLSGLPMFGVPFAIKDNIDAADLPTTAACPAFAYWPGRSAESVRRLLEAGAILVGKTNLDQFATGLTGVRSPFGACESVFGGRLISGGSSSGSAVAVATGEVPFALGTDTAGSGRVPAAMNGIVGCKPTRGLVSTAGVVPACRSLDCVSVFAVDVGDAAAVLSVIAGYNPADPWSRRVPLPPAPGGPAPGSPGLAARQVRIAVGRDLDFCGDDAMRSAYHASVSRVANAIAGAEEGGPAGIAGCQQAGEPAGNTRVAGVFETDITPLVEAGDLLYRGPWIAERLADLQEFLLAHPQDVLLVTRQVIESGHRHDAVAAFRAMHRLRELSRWTDLLWERADMLLLPTVPTTYTIEQIMERPIERNSLLGRYTQFANLLDLAVITVPAGRTSDGRPASVSLIGPAFSDSVLAELGADLLHPALPATHCP